MSTPAILASQRAVALSIFTFQNAGDLDSLVSLLSDDPATRVFIRPGSLKGRFPEGGIEKGMVKAMLEEHRTKVKEVGFQEPEEVIQEANKVVVWLKANGKTVDDSAYTNEYMFIVYFETDGTKITKIVEFVDSLYVAMLAKGN
ncbi:hypothetical protein MNV49_004480 [Pseudohyphozyma bogoriensis]|nr:hypothetical protein MNV49_004480 [Pseudohyphozyma bogoriensis]